MGRRMSGSRVPRRIAAAAVAILVLTGGSACSSGGADAGSTPTAPSPSPTPTPAPILWANDVCVARDGLMTSVSALGRNLSYDVTSDRSALEQIDRQVRLQVVALGNAADRLGTALQGVPVDFTAANDLVSTVSTAKSDLEEAVAATQQHLDTMMSSDSIVTGVAEAAQALVAARAAFAAGQAMVGALTDAAGTANADLSAAFAAAPACQSASAAPTASSG